jgi:hypothetical protein
MQQRMRGFVICNLLYSKGIIDRTDKSQLSHYSVNMQVAMENVFAVKGGCGEQFHNL